MHLTHVCYGYHVYFSHKSASVSLMKCVLVKWKENVNNNVITASYNLLSQTQTTNNIQPMRAKIDRIEYYGYKCRNSIE